MSVDNPAEHRKRSEPGANADLSDARHDAYAQRGHHNLSGIERLANPSSSNPYMTAAEWAQNVEALRQQGSHIVSKGESLRTVAEYWLRMSHQPTDRNTVNMEMDRIVDLNSGQYPKLARNHILQPDMILKIWTPDLGPADMSTRYSAWREAPAGITTVAGRGQQLYVEHGNLIASPGSRIALGPDSAGFVASGAVVKDADRTALIINSGGKVEHSRGADYIDIPQIPGQQAVLVSSRQAAQAQVANADAQPAAEPPKKHKNFFERLFSHDDTPRQQQANQVQAYNNYSGGGGG
jgi:hypothetical protein